MEKNVITKKTEGKNNMFLYYSQNKLLLEQFINEHDKDKTKSLVISSHAINVNKNELNFICIEKMSMLILLDIINIISPELPYFANPNYDKIYKAVEFIAVIGSHKLDTINPEYHKYFYAFNAWHCLNRLPPATDRVMDITDYIRSAINAMIKILKKDNEYLEKGYVWKSQNDLLEMHSYVINKNLENLDIVCRKSEKFTNKLYKHNERTFAAVFAYNEIKKIYVLSFADDFARQRISKQTATEIITNIFGYAFGRENIAFANDKRYDYDKKYYDRLEIIIKNFNTK